MDDLFAQARARDAADPLASFRARFYPPTDGSVYLDGNSLGLLSRDAEAAVHRALGEWRTHAVGGWLDAGWFDLAERLAARAAALVGAEPGEVAVANSTTVNLHQLLASLYEPPRRVLAFAGDFPSDLYALASHLRLRGLDPATHLELVPAGPDRLLDEREVAVRLTDPARDLGLVVLPAVVYTTGQLLDLPFLCDAAHRAGALVGFDLSHSIGALPHTLDADGVDFAFWCHYKYLNAGPGAVGGLYLNRRHHHERSPGLAGWWGADKTRQFDMAPELTPAGDAGALQIGTPPILSLAALDGALTVIEEAGVERTRGKSLALTDYLMRLVKTALPTDVTGFRFANPREPRRRGGHVALVHPEAARLCRALRAAGVVADHRPPDIMRFAPVALYNTFTECAEAVRRLREILVTRSFERQTAGRELVP